MYTPIAWIIIIRVLLAFASIYKLVVHQMDVYIVFLHGDLEEKIYMDQHELVKPGQEWKVCMLVGSFYKPSTCHETFDFVILFFGFQINEYDEDREQIYSVLFLC